MQVVILAAGQGTRLLPLTATIPKPMVLLAGRPILEHILDELPKRITEVVIVVGQRGHFIQDYFGTEWKDRPITYAVQNNPDGTTSALRAAEPLLRDPFLVLYADDLHSKAGLERVTAHPLSLLIAEVEHPEHFGVVELRPGGSVARIVEKPDHPATNLVSTGAFVLDKRIFNYSAPAGHTGEFLLPDLMTQLAADDTMMTERAEFWFPIAYPEDITRAEAALKERQH